MDKKIKDDAIITSLMTGFAELDSILGGNNRQEQALLVGRLGMDKIEFWFTIVEGLLDTTKGS